MNWIEYEKCRSFCSCREFHSHWVWRLERGLPQKKICACRPLLLLPLSSPCLLRGFYQVRFPLVLHTREILKYTYLGSGHLSSGLTFPQGVTLKGKTHFPLFSKTYWKHSVSESCFHSYDKLIILWLFKLHDTPSFDKNFGVKEYDLSNEGGEVKTQVFREGWESTVSGRGTTPEPLDAKI